MSLYPDDGYLPRIEEGIIHWMFRYPSSLLFEYLLTIGSFIMELFSTRLTENFTPHLCSENMSYYSLLKTYGPPNEYKKQA